MATPLAERPHLTGRRILICRPEPEASRLADAFRTAGAETRVLPLMAREALPETPESRNILLDLDRYSHVIAVSPFAARRLLEEIDTWWPQIPVGIRWYAVGAGTAKVLASHGLSVRQPAEGWTSEALLALASLRQVAGEKILLARGDNGRELIRETLEARGATVTALPLYRRYCPDYTQEDIRKVLGDFSPDAIVALSGETLDNLIALCAKSGHNLYDRLLIVPADRVAQRARAAGFTRWCVPVSLADADIVATVAATLDGRNGGAGNNK